jgi:hypothetical protein
MAEKSLMQLLTEGTTLQEAARLTKRFSELNNTIVKILSLHFDEVQLDFAPKRPHVWEDRFAVLMVSWGTSYKLFIPIPELIFLDEELAKKVKKKMTTQIDMNVNYISNEMRVHYKNAAQYAEDSIYSVYRKADQIIASASRYDGSAFAKLPDNVQREIAEKIVSIAPTGRLFILTDNPISYKNGVCRQGYFPTPGGWLSGIEFGGEREAFEKALRFTFPNPTDESVQVFNRTRAQENSVKVGEIAPCTLNAELPAHTFWVHLGNDTRAMVLENGDLVAILNIVTEMHQTTAHYTPATAEMREIWKLGGWHQAVVMFAERNARTVYSENAPVSD